MTAAERGPTGPDPYARPPAGATDPGPVGGPPPGAPEPPPGPRALVARGVTVTYGRLVAVADVDLVVEPGTLLALTGPSGAGKSSLLWALAGAVPTGRGEVTSSGTRVGDRRVAVDLGIALVPQGNGLAGVLTARENLVFPLLAAGVTAGEAAERTAAALDGVGLGDSADHLVEELSGGQQQRVAVARGLAARGTVLLADEPTSELDHANRGRVLELLRAEADRGAVVIMATHDPEAAQVCDGEVRLDEGRLTRLR